jgi:hypothetical protein
MVLEGIGLPITYPLLGYGLPVIILNCITSYLACRRMSIVGARWVWIPLALSIAYYDRATYRGVLDQTFGPECADSECLYQFFFGAPFVGTVAYALMSVLVRWNTTDAN